MIWRTAYSLIGTHEELKKRQCPNVKKMYRFKYKQSLWYGPMNSEMLVIVTFSGAQFLSNEELSEWRW